MTRPAPPDLPDDPVDVMPVFTSRRKAEQLPSLRPALVSKRLDRGWDRRLAWADWRSGFLCGVVVTFGGLCLVVVLAGGMQ